MSVIDERGRLFGAVNVVDALGVLLVVSLLIAGGALLAGGGGASSSATVTFEATVESPVANATLSEEAAPRDMEIVEGPTVVSAWYNETERTRYSRLRFTAIADVRVTDGWVYLERDRVFVGNNLTVDFNVTRFTATVTDLEVDDGE